MKIGIDAHGIGGHSFAPGNETYFGNLIRELLAIDNQNEYHIFVNHPESMAATVKGRANARLVALRPKSQWIQRPFSLPLYSRTHGLDLVHVPFCRPPFTGAKTIVTVHDANFELFPQDFTTVELCRLKLLVPSSCRDADLIFTVSEYAKDELCRLYNLPRQKVVVTYNAADHFLDRAAVASRLEGAAVPHQDAAPGSTRFPEPYIFFVGMIAPKKNLVRLVKAFDLIKSRTSLPHQLVIAGKWGWKNEELKAVLPTLRYRGSIHFPGYLTPAQLDRLLLRAEVFVFPSLYEAFGIPPMEAQAFGVPVLISETTCFPEIYGNSAAYCDPYSVDSIAAALESLLLDPVKRAELVALGRKRVSHFQWNRTARTALAAYQSLFAKDPSPAADLVGTQTP